MPALFVFLLKVNVALIVFCLGYYLVLRRLTFYTLNRVYLGIAIIFSTVYPLINVDNFVQKHNIPVQNVVVDWKIPTESFVNPLVQQAVYWNWATILFWAGAALFATRLLIQLLSLFKLYRNSKPGVIQEHDVRIVKANISPFSFWQSIYINPDSLNPDDLKSVLQHEQIHVNEWHTLDILLTEISAIFYWFNPGVWLMKKAVRENIEFITDRKILQKGMDSKAYQYSLLNVSFSAATAAGITNNFNFSTLKKRITMMNAKRSSNVNLTRYAFLVPAVLICLFAISLSKAELVKKSKIAYKHITASVIDFNKVMNVIPVAAEKKTVHQPKVLDTIKKPKTVSVTLTPPPPDTVRVTNNKTGTMDSVTIVADGRIINSLSEINADDINTITIQKDKKTPNGLIVVQTKHPTIFTATVSPTGYVYNGKNAPGVVVTNNNNLDNQNLDNLKEVTVTGYGTPKTVTATTVPITGILINNTGKPNNVTVIGGGVPKASMKNFSFPNKTSDSKIDGFADKLIFIDDKEASAKDMKKLSAADILTVDVHKNKDLIDKYGDKAKNGVIFITTKKGK